MKRAFLAFLAGACLLIPGAANATYLPVPTTFSGTTCNDCTMVRPVLMGTAAGDDAVAGQIGEVIAGTRASGSALSLTNNTALNVTSVSLTAGDWDCRGAVNFVLSGVSMSAIKLGISTTTAAYGAQDTFNLISLAAIGLSATTGYNAPVTRISTASTATVYLVGQAAFTLGSSSAYGSLWCRRVR